MKSPSSLVKGCHWRASPLIRLVLRIVPLLYSPAQSPSDQVCATQVCVLWAPNCQFLSQGGREGYKHEEKLLCLLGPDCPEETRTDLMVTNVFNMTHCRMLELLGHLGRRFCSSLLSILPFLPTDTMRLSWRRGRWCTDWDTVEWWNCWASS